MPPDFDPNFQIPRWGWWIVVYFFLGGITGGVYFAATWLDLFGDANDRAAMRFAHLIAFPLIVVGGLSLIVDLGQPLRFWHMIFESERFPVPILKLYSPISLGSAILGTFGIVSFVSFVDATLGKSRWLHASDNAVGKAWSVLGAVVGLALSGYTGVLLSATNEPVWGNSPWIGALFLFSGISTGIAALVLVARRVPRTTVEKLSEADNYMMVFELVTLIVFLVTLGAVGARFIFGTPTAILFAVVIVIGMLIPLALHWRPTLAGGRRTASVLSAVLVLVGGFVLRWAVLAGAEGIGL
ncbi:MAG TPA: NrfD/PsrC family molybdoenzyme membrane anchor subunit [Chloroflexota bacterium]|nr:NrfD/PsrC family molybdoenzyme membrane anchor subunit [Chloroflexota bacterium]